ncbi:MAG TPA: ABC transporter permease [Clostridia bacterium]|nr:ABC transporter permease [Clostridia bacterium]
MNVFKSIYEYRELLKTNVKKEIRGKYKQSFLGILWSFLNPLLQIAVYAIIFPIILKNTQKDYVIFLCVALIPWTYFTTAIVQSMSSIISNSNIIKKVYFPRVIVPLSVVTSGCVNFFISTIIILIFLFVSGMGITQYIIFYPLIALVQFLLLLAISFIVSSVTVYLRDLEHLIGVALQLLFYATPIVYAKETIPENMQNIINLNPMAHIITAYRDIFYYQTAPDVVGLLILLGITIIMCIVGYLLFNVLQKGFAEEL